MEYLGNEARVYVRVCMGVHVYVSVLVFFCSCLWSRVRSIAIVLFSIFHLVPEFLTVEKVWIKESTEPAHFTFHRQLWCNPCSVNESVLLFRKRWASNFWYEVFFLDWFRAKPSYGFGPNYAIQRSGIAPNLNKMINQWEHIIQHSRVGFIAYFNISSHKVSVYFAPNRRNFYLSKLKYWKWNVECSRPKGGSWRMQRNLLGNQKSSALYSVLLSITFSYFCGCIFALTFDQ